jgi:hypothetical protein
MRATAAFAAAVVALAVPATVAAEPSQEFVAGAAWIAYPDFPAPGMTTTEQTIVNAHRSEDGEVHGNIVVHSPFGDLRAEATCLVVIGNTAVVGGRTTRADVYLGFTFTHLSAKIQDNGEGEDPPDRAISIGWLSRPAEFDPCLATLPFPAAFEAVRGNYVVAG